MGSAYVLIAACAAVAVLLLAALFAARLCRARRTIRSLAPADEAAVARLAVGLGRTGRPPSRIVYLLADVARRRRDG